MTVRSWITPSTLRNFPSTPARPARPVTLHAALNESSSFQVALRSEAGPPRGIRVRVAGPRGWMLRVRRVGFVPLCHHNPPAIDDPLETDGLGLIPGYVPDPLLEEDTVLLPEAETHAFWVSVCPGRSATPGPHTLRVTVEPDSGPPAVHPVGVVLHDVVIGARHGFDITHWFYVDALMDWYRTGLFDRHFWRILPEYVRNVTAHGQNMLYVPVFTPPLDGVKRPSQLLHVTRRGPDQYRFDWRDVARYIDLARRCGITRFEWCHPFTQWGAAHAIRVYEGQGLGEKRLWPPSTRATGRVYRRFLEQYLPELHAFLVRNRILKQSRFHVSDEPHGEQHIANYRKARAMLRDIAPWMTVMDAMSDVRFAQQGLTDMPIASIAVANEFVAQGHPCWCYYCCGPRGPHLNRLLDTPLAKVAMHGFLFYHRPFNGFLHWGYNYWYRSQTRELIDPFTVQDGGTWPNWAYGDPFVVYPGPHGPVDSMRWEVFAESLQDYALLQTLDLPRSHKWLAAIRGFDDFPKDRSWRLRARTRLLKAAAGELRE